jgi:hypothetical protein
VILGHANERTTLASSTHSMRRTKDVSADKTAAPAELGVTQPAISRQPTLGALWRAVCIDVRSSTLWSSLDLSCVGPSVEDQVAVANRNVIARIVIHLHRCLLRAQPVAHRVARPLL